MQILVFSQTNIDSRILDEKEFSEKQSRHKYFNDGEQFISALSSFKYDLVIMNIGHDKYSWGFVNLARKNCRRNVPIILLDQSGQLPEDRNENTVERRKNPGKITLIRAAENRTMVKDGTDAAIAMAATLCHEINNPLMAISAITEVLQEKCSHLPADITEKIENIAKATKRIQRVTHRLIGMDSIKYRETSGDRMVAFDDFGSDEIEQIDSMMPKLRE